MNRFILALSIMCAVLLGEAAAKDLELYGTWTSVRRGQVIKGEAEGRSRREVLVLWIQAVTQNDSFPMTSKSFNLEHPAFRDQTFWRLTGSGGGKEEVLKYRIVAEPAPSGVVDLYLVPEKRPKVGVSYKAVPAPGKSLAGMVKPPYRLKNEERFLTQPVDSSHLSNDLAHVEANEGVKTNISVKTGDKNTAKLEMFWGFEDWNETSDWRFQAHALAEGTYRPKKGEKALSRILGEIEYLYTTDLGFGQDPFLAAVWQTGGVARIESDQEFENVEGSLGVSTWFAMNGRAIKKTSDFLCLNGDAEQFAAPLLLNFSYTVVQRMEDSADGASRDFEDVTHRLNGKIYWSFPLLRDLHFERFTPLLDTYNLNVVVNSGFAYDFRASEFFPDVEASLELTPHQEGKPTFLLTYKNGKSTTRFENYDALLAGIKVKF